MGLLYVGIAEFLRYSDDKKVVFYIILISVAPEMKIEYSKCRVRTAQQKMIITGGGFFLWDQ